MSPRASLTPAQLEALNNINETVAATRYPDRTKQRNFLDTMTVSLVRCYISITFSTC